MSEAPVFVLTSLSWKGRLATSAYAGGKGLPSPLSLLSDLKVLLFSQYVVCVVCGVKGSV